ncbi:MAG: sulfite exporter TauE/SafE family protein [Nitrososphaerota archaeon]|nr:sulfite exporter TauE/SafE family protein [Nitrososphaerota archaeon]
MTVKPLNGIRLTIWKLSVAFLSGLILGVVAGLIGVGGGEFRIPVLLHVLRLPLLTMIPVNLMVGLITVSVSFARRFQLDLWNSDHLSISLTMSATSILGAYFGAFLTGRIPEKPVKILLIILLVAVGLKIMIEPFTQFPVNPRLNLGFIEILLVLFTGFAIGVISGMLGVAGGEFRIPTLMYVFGFNVVAAGTISLFVSIPTVASGLVKHHNMKHMNQKATVIAIVMSTGSVIGALIGATYVKVVEENLLKIMLGAILIMATIRMMIKH